MFKVEKYMPPGENLSQIKKDAYYVPIYGVSSIFTFLIYTLGSLRYLYDPVTGEMLKDACMEDFRTFWDYGFYRMYWVYTLALIISRISQNYRYFRKPSKSIYTMARIRSPWELHIRCWTVPLLTALAMVSGRVVLRTVFFIIYVLVTPTGVPKPGFDQLIGGLL